MTGARRSGFAIMMALWLLVAAAAVGLTLASVTRSSMSAITNRNALIRNTWMAEGCLARLRAKVDDSLITTFPHMDNVWRAIDSVAAGMTSGGHCTWAISAAGSLLDVNAASGEQLRLAVGSLAHGDGAADSVVDAILDWRDADDSPRLSGAEADWYRANHQSTPRNGPIESGAELLSVRGVREIEGIDAAVGVERGRIVLGRAPTIVLASLPGFGPEAVARASAGGATQRDLLEFASMLSPKARDELQGHYAELQQIVTLNPDAWIIAASAGGKDSPARATVEVRVILSGSRAAVVRQRVFP